MRESELEKDSGQGNPRCRPLSPRGWMSPCWWKNLRLTPTERLEQQQNVIGFFEDLQQVGVRGAAR
jgi:hypothetical protein